MKKIVYFNFLVIVMLIGFIGCDNGNGNGNSTITYEVDENFRFNNGGWTNWSGDSGVTISGATSTLTMNTFTVSGGGINISFSNVYTDGGGTFSEAQWTGGGSWAYLYEISGKIGIVVKNNSDGAIYVPLGKETIISWFGSNFDATGIQEIINGYAEWNP